MEQSPKPASINLQKWFLSPTGLIKPLFHTEGNLSLCSSYIGLGVPNWVANTTTNQECFEALLAVNIMGHAFSFHGVNKEYHGSRDLRTSNGGSSLCGDEELSW
jgi:hypothetical protein